jgi:hypothetical protein
MLVNENNSQPYMKSLTTCLNKVINDGYTENFKVTESGLEAIEHSKTYSPGEVEVINFFRFEGTSNPDDEAVLYVIETTDGTKGTLTDAYGVYNDPVVSEFMKNVQHIHKKNTSN